MAYGERSYGSGERRSFGSGRGGPRREGGFHARRSFGPREMHKAVCSDCKQECDVPFKPSGDRPVYCRECFAKRKEGGVTGSSSPAPAPKKEVKEETEEVAEETAEEANEESEE